MSGTSKQPDSQEEEIAVIFHPQVWRDNRALTGDPFKFTVPREDATDDNGNLLEDNTGASDRLREHENAPEKARMWQGPFYVTLEE